MKLKNIIYIIFIGLFVSCENDSAVDKVSVSKRQILVNDVPYLIKGICYHPVPKGSPNKRSFETLSQDIALMKEAGINTIRVYTPIEEVEVLDELAKNNIKVIIGFGYNQDGYYDIHSGSFIDYVKKFKNHNAILLWELGNEYNYHPEWFNGDLKNWYKAMNDAAALIHKEDPNHLVTTAHGDLPDEVALKHSSNIDVWGLNVYRWDKPGTIYKQWEAVSDKPMYLSEAGGDSYMTITKAGYEKGENQKAQADANKNILKEVFENNHIGSGITLFSFTDGWWKAGNYDTQDPGGWAPNSSGVPYDGSPNEEYWGIVDIDRNKKQTFDVVKKAYNKLDVEVYETSASGNKLTKITEFTSQDSISKITINPKEEFQTITGFGGSFTESSAYLLNKLSKENRDKVLQAYFSEEGANYSLTRTHISSCDFSLNNYTYAPVENDLELKHFSIKEDKDDLIPMIKDAMKISKDGFHIIASPWSAPPWMKDNKKYVGGKLLPEYNDVFALFFSKYLEAYKAEGIDIWGLTPVNEPHGNGNNWESMHFSPEEETNFVQHHLGPLLEKKGFGNVNILGYDQNREGLKEWADAMYKDEASSKYFAGTAVHWYESTFMVFPEALQYAHNKAPNKYLIETEGCVDSEIPKWQDDAWYWRKEATDWGWDWAPEHQKSWHPKYSPVNRYARDIIGCLNNWVDGWIDWNMVLDTQGGPNWFKNWCVAPVIVKPETDEVYFTPIYYTMAHFSKFIRPKAKRIGFTSTDKDLQVTSAKNPDGSVAVVVFNQGERIKSFSLNLENKSIDVTINPQAIQTILIPTK